MRYLVTVKNEETGEEVEVQVETGDRREAMEQALCRFFRERGWRKATAAANVIRESERPYGPDGPHGPACDGGPGFAGETCPACQETSRLLREGLPAPEQAPPPQAQVCFYCGLPLSPDEGVRQIGREATGREVVIRFHQDAGRQCWQRFAVGAINHVHEAALRHPRSREEALSVPDKR